MENHGIIWLALGASALVATGAMLHARQTPQPPVAEFHFQIIESEKLRDGDLIFRRGHDATSRAVLAADGSSSFSHVGLIVKQNGVVYVVHAVPSERADRADGVVMDTLEFFSDPERADAVAVYRDKSLDSAKAKKITLFAEGMLGRPFDEKFDLSEQNKLYCTELVWAAYRSQGVSLISAPDILHVPFLGEQFIFPRTLLSSRLLSPVTI